jgi:hypothetical protein
MKKFRLFCSVYLLCLLGFAATSTLAQRAPAPPNSNAGPNGVIVHGQFGGDIFGFDIDPNGSDGLLCEAVSNSNGTVHAAIETFDQASGRTIAVVAESFTQDDFVTLGVVGQSIGIIEQEHPKSLFHVVRRFRIINPLDSNMLTGKWTPPLDPKHIINQVKASQADTDDVAVYAIDVSTQQTPLVFTSHVAANTFSSVIPITDPVFTTEAPPVIAYDNVRNQVILGHDFPSPFILPPRIGFVDLATGSFTKMTGHGFGVINGIAVDTEDGILCTDTSADSGVQFYDLSTMTGFGELLPGARPDENLANGEDIEFDPVNKLFLIAQTFSNGLLDNGSSIQVYDTAGNYVEEIDGLNFQGGFNVFPTHISLNPGRRVGFVNGPDLTKSLQAFSY